MSKLSIRSRAPLASSPAVRHVMRTVRRYDTSAELNLRRSLHARGLRYRIHVRPVVTLRCTADVVFSRERLCVFVDGCFWHRCPTHFTLPKSNTSWWNEKIDATVRRDRRQAKLLTKEGWRVVRIWEHELSNQETDKVARRIHALLVKLRSERRDN